MNVYGRAMTDSKRQAHGKVVQMVLQPANVKGTNTAEERTKDSASDAIVG